MIHPGTDLKFRMTVLFEGFDATRDDFSLVIRDRFYREYFDFTKDDFYNDSEGNWYFTMESVPTGMYYASFRGEYPDDDYEKRKRVVTDKQGLCAVGLCGCEATVQKCPCGEHQVIYEQIWTKDLDDGTYLVDKEGNPILTNDGRKITFRRK